MPIHERNGDLFSAGNSVQGYAQCVSSCVSMHRGIALQFRARFPAVNDLPTGTPVGGCIVAYHGEQVIFNLVSKPHFASKPTTRTLRNSIRAFREAAEAEGVTSVALARIGCGLDRMRWYDVRRILQTEFQGSNIHLYVYTFQ